MSQEVWKRIEASGERWNVLRHPFYRRWSDGELTAAELATYSGQYRHAVAAIATMSGAAAAALPERTDLAGHAGEEAAHVRLWDGFVDGVGGDSEATPTAETRACVAAWTAGGDVLATLARLYAIEAAQPEISRTKREGLLGRYRLSDGAATAYFRVHERRDAEHAAEVRDLLEDLAGPDDADRMASAAEAALRANWRLLDGV